MTTELKDALGHVDMCRFIETGDDADACAALAASLTTYGAVLVRDPRTRSADSDRFLDMLESYFAQPRDVKLRDVRADLSYQVGATPDMIERPRDNSTIADTLPLSERPVSDARARARDVKWRFFWRVGPRPDVTDFPELNAPPVIPAAFPQWRSVMDGWGASLLSAIHSVSQMLALGLGLERNAIAERLENGPHLLAPTGVDMVRYGESVGQTLAGFHYDLNALTIHGQARFPGLFIWTRDGRRVQVRVPTGFLLVQSGAQIEAMTAGAVPKGMHEVVVCDDTVHALRKRVKRNEEHGLPKNTPVWRVSSTMFGHVRSDAPLDPIGHLADRPGAAAYAGRRAGEQVADELKAIELSG